MSQKVYMCQYDSEKNPLQWKKELVVKVGKKVLNKKMYI